MRSDVTCLEDRVIPLGCHGDDPIPFRLVRTRRLPPRLAHPCSLQSHPCTGECARLSYTGPTNPLQQCQPRASAN